MVSPKRFNITGHYTPVRPDGDHPRPYGDRTATRKCTRSPANVNTTREKVSNNYKLKQSCVLTAFLLRPVRSYHDLSAHMAFLVRSMGSATAITGDPAALSPRSWGSYHASSTCIASARISSDMMTNTKYSDDNDVVVVRTPWNRGRVEDPMKLPLPM